MAEHDRRFIPYSIHFPFHLLVQLFPATSGDPHQFLRGQVLTSSYFPELLGSEPLPERRSRVLAGDSQDTFKGPEYFRSSPA